MQRMSRAQRLLLVYILLKLEEPRIIQEITRLYGGGGGISQIQQASDVDTSAIGDDKILVFKAASSKHEYEAKPSGGVTDHGALSGLTDDDHTQYLLVNGSRAMTGNLKLGDHDLLLSNVLALVRYDEDTAAIWDPVDDWTESLRVFDLHAEGDITYDGELFLGYHIKATGTYARFYTKEDATSKIEFASYDGATWWNNVIRFSGGWCWIFRAKVVDPLYFALDGEIIFDGTSHPTITNDTLILKFDDAVPEFKFTITGVGDILKLGTSTALNANATTHDLDPVADNTYDLGESGARWKKAWINNIDNAVLIQTDKLQVSTQTRIIGNTYASQVTTDGSGDATVTFAANMGTTKPVVILTPELNPATDTVFAQISSFNIVGSNYTGFNIRTTNDRGAAVASVTVHYVVYRKSAF